MPKFKVPEGFIALDPVSEVIALTTYGNTKNLIVTAMEYIGPFEEEAMRRAAIRAANDFPLLGCCLKEISHYLVRHLVWEPRPDLEFPVTVSDLSSRDPEKPVLDSLLDHLAPRLERDWDLFSELPGEFHIVRLGNDHYVTASAIHHAVSDAQVASEYGRRVLLYYREIVTGTGPDLSQDQSRSLSTSGKRFMPTRKRSLWDDLIFSVGVVLRFIRQKAVLPAGNGKTGDKAQYHIKRLLSAEETLRLVSASPRMSAWFIDRLAAGTNLAVDKWNAHRNVMPGIITTAVTVNMAGRYSGATGPNKAGVIFFASSPEQRKDRDSFIRFMTLERIKRFRDQMDIKLHENMGRMAGSLRLLPFNFRRKIFHYFAEKHQYSLAVTLLGVVWPVIRNGKSTGESFPTHAGELNFSEMHAMGYKLLSGTKVVLIAYGYRGRLNLVMATSAELFTREEGEAFLDLIVEELRQGAEQTRSPRREAPT